MPDPALFTYDHYAGVARARVADPAPSKAAARMMNRTGTARGHAASILAAVRAQPGLTAVGLGDATGLGYIAVDRRGIDLERAGLIRRHGVENGKLRWWPV